MWQCNNCDFINNDDSAGTCAVCGKQRLSVPDERKPVPPKSGKPPVVTLFLALMIIVLAASFALPQRADAKGPLSTGNPATQVYAGNNYSLAVFADGSVVYAGDSERMREAVSSWRNVESADGYFARLKDGTYTSVYGKTNLPVTEGAIRISTGSAAGEWVALLPDGSLLFAPPESGQFDSRDIAGYGFSDYRCKQVAFGNDSYYALLYSGRIIPHCPLYSPYMDAGAEISSWTDVKEICLNDGFLPVALTNDGKVLSPSVDEYVNTSDWNNVKNVVSNYFLTVGLCHDGTVLATGGEYGKAPISEVISAWTEIIDIEVSNPDWNSLNDEDVFAVGLREDGTVAFAGDPSNANSFELMNELKNWTDIVQISVGCAHVIGLREDGTFVTAGDNSSGQCNL